MKKLNEITNCPNLKVDQLLNKDLSKIIGGNMEACENGCYVGCQPGGQACSKCATGKKKGAAELELF